MAEHIKLGHKAALRGYSLANDGLAIHRESANPFSAKLNTSEQYGDVEGWNEWVVDDWTGGVGYKDPEEGYLFGQADTRFPNQVMLPFGLDYPDTDEQLFSGSMYTAGDTTCDGTLVTKIAQSLTAGTTGRQVEFVWVYLDAVTGTTVTVTVNNAGTGEPGSTAHATGTASVTKYRPGPIWLRIPLAAPYTMTASTVYHLVFSADASFTVPNITGANGFASSYDGVTWTPSDSFQVLLSFVETVATLVLEADAAGDTVILEADSNGDTIQLVEAGDARIKFFAQAGGVIYCAYGIEVRHWDESTATWISVDTLATEVTSMISTGSQVWWAYGTGLSTVTPATSKTNVTNYDDDADLLCVHKGLMYKTDANNVYYSSTGADSSWTGPFAVGSSQYSIRGLAGMGDDLFLSTDQALYVLAPGDYVVGMEPWPTVSSLNGKGMISWMSDLYIPLVDDLIQYNQGGGLVQVGLKRAEGLPVDLQGTITYLHSTQYFLLASVAPEDDGGYGSVWAYNGKGWHGIATLPQDCAGGAMYVDKATNSMWFGGDYGVIARLSYPSSVLNPAQQTTPKFFARYGWLEYDWFWGGPIELQKDIESVFFYAEDTDSTSYFTVYWQDDESTDWELLGTFTTNTQERRWTAYTPGSVTRPETRRIKLGILIRTDDEEATPLLRAQRLKFHTMITDRWRWNLSIETHDDQQMLGQAVNAYTRAQMHTHLTSMVQAVRPIIFEDIDENQYEVKVTSATVRPTKLEMRGTTKTVHYQWDISLESVVQGPYSG